MVRFIFGRMILLDDPFHFGEAMFYFFGRRSCHFWQAIILLDDPFGSQRVFAERIDDNLTNNEMPVLDKPIRTRHISY